MHNQPPRSHVYRQPNVVATQVTATVKWFNPERGYGFVKVGDSGKDALLPASLVVPAGHTTLPDGATVVVDIVEDRKGQQVSVLHSVDLSTAAPARPPARDRGFGDRGGDRGFGDRGDRGFGTRRDAGGPRERSFGDRGGDRNFGDRGGDRGGFQGRGQDRGYQDRSFQDRGQDRGFQDRGQDRGPRRPQASGPTSEVGATVKWFNGGKGYGFAQPDDGGRDVFIPARALESAGLRGLDDGQRVRMTIRQGEKGMEAVSLKIE
ncbi:cold shock protein (beta-ribbon, CspA family) [Azospirillum oryzae]|uniref:Cold shock protein (Beta-ribbon, CspA family) n=1 Tax=Azospirillum oryzae TaxID=286727 RepID=A0A1X7HAW4_9PROT|nr:cold-shock protein [Azospirillum oryzae]SMF82929.1 cold shock protein (beta-ribbon, CspA family) [Azospirillum oryzae]